MSCAELERLEDQVTDMLVELGLPPEPYGEHLYAFAFGSTAVMVSLFEASGGCWVRLAATVLEGIRPNLELVTRVLRLNTEVPIGSFLIFEDNTLGFAVTLPGPGLQPASFRVALEHVAAVANGCGDELAAVAGGRTVSDLVG